MCILLRPRMISALRKTNFLSAFQLSQVTVRLGAFTFSGNQPCPKNTVFKNGNILFVFHPTFWIHQCFQIHHPGGIFVAVGLLIMPSCLLSILNVYSVCIQCLGSPKVSAAYDGKNMCFRSGKTCVLMLASPITALSFWPNKFSFCA